MSFVNENTAVHCHGRHLGAIGWKQHMWLASDGRLGQIPTMLLIALKKRAMLLSFGTGASEKDGLLEAAWTKRFALEHLSDLKSHELFVGEDFGWLEHLLFNARLDLKSQNTVEEIRQLYESCDLYEITQLYTVTNPSHGPRCRRDIDVHAPNQELRRNTFVTTSEVPFDNADTSDTVILEPPHRGDDHSPPFYRLVPKIFRIPQEKKQGFYREFEALLKAFER